MIFQEDTSTLSLTCRSKLVSYYLHKGFVMLERNSQALENLSLGVEQYMNAVNIFDSDYVITCNAAITSVANNLNNIHLSTII